MYKISMPPIKRKYRDRYIFVPGDWQADVPNIQVEQSVLDAWTRYLRQDGLGVIESVKRAHEMGQMLMNASYRSGLLDHTSYWAKKYAKRYPSVLTAHDLEHKIYTLNGFDPQTIQTSYVPFHRVGRVGQPFMNTMLREMYENKS